jgi:predicted Zn-dependent peptidase
MAASGTLAQENKFKFNPIDYQVDFTRFTLPNGLRLLVHEDHKAPVVAVNVWYHVGSKNEKNGKSGFAHLFEHLMFNGSEHFNNDYFQALEAIGATDLNGTTNEDRTNYFQTVPVSALDQVLWLESDRMGHLLGAIDQSRLDEQRGVVQNEKRQGENQPYALGYDIIQKEMYPPHHPYGHTVIGEMEDLNAASLEDVRQWFKAYYGASNAVLVLAGDISPSAAYEKVLHYFGNIPAGPPISRPRVNIPVRSGETRASYQDRVPEAQLDIVWNTPQWGTQESVYLDLLSDVLTSGKNSRLYKALVYDKQLATSVYSYNYGQEIAGNFVITANVKKGVEPETVEKEIKIVLGELLSKGVSGDELERLKSAYFSGFLKGLERIGGFGGKSDLLALNEVFGGDGNFYRKTLQWYADATTADIQAAGLKYLNGGQFVLTCTPFPDYSVTGKEADRKIIPELGKQSAVSFPVVQHGTLSNGLKIMLASRNESPTVVMNLMFNAGYSSDRDTGKPGLANIAMDMLDEGTATKSSLQINEQLQSLGASVGSYSDLDFSSVTLNTLMPNLDASLDIWADILLNPAFPENELNRLKQETISNINSESKDPQALLLRIMPALLYGKDHPYGMPMTGSGDEATVKNLSRTDVTQYYQKYCIPNNATLVVTGNLTMPDLIAKLEARLSRWKKGKPVIKSIPAVSKPSDKQTIYLLDRPQAGQTMIMAGYLIQPYGQIDELALEQMNNVLGGDFTSRINLNIREDKHWSYGAGSYVAGTRAQRPYIFYAPVQTDKTAESISELKKEVEQFIRARPITEKEFEKTRQNSVLSTAGMWETNNRVNGFLSQIVRYNLPDSYWNTYSTRLQNLTIDDIEKATTAAVTPEKMDWFLAGDVEKILPELQKLNMEIILLDAEGKPVKRKTP